MMASSKRKKLPPAELSTIMFGGPYHGQTVTVRDRFDTWIEMPTFMGGPIDVDDFVAGPLSETRYYGVEWTLDWGHGFQWVYTFFLHESVAGLKERDILPDIPLFDCYVERVYYAGHGRQPRSPVYPAYEYGSWCFSEN